MLSTQTNEQQKKVADYWSRKRRAIRPWKAPGTIELPQGLVTPSRRRRRRRLGVFNPFFFFYYFSETRRLETFQFCLNAFAAYLKPHFQLPPREMTLRSSFLAITYHDKMLKLTVANSYVLDLIFENYTEDGTD